MDAGKLGSRIRKFRESKEISREQLAELSSLTLAQIEDLEEKNMYPSLGPLQKVARALNVRLGTFMDDVHCKDPVIVRRNDSENDLIMQRSHNKRAAYRYFSLGKGKNDRNMEPFFIEIQPEAPEDQELSSHQGEEFIIVSSGKLKIVYGKEISILEPGDTVYYNSIVPHYVGAEGGPCTIYAIIFHP
jgi:transcriptional regulator with XRE-family HTH domain